jgi:hypothetical protein
MPPLPVHRPPPPPHRIQSPLKPEARRSSRSPSDGPGLALAAALSPSSALNKLKISFEEPKVEPQERPPTVVVEEKPRVAGRKKQAKQKVAPAPTANGSQPSMTDFFAPVRRSSRKTQATLAKETEWRVAQAVRSGKEDGLLVSPTLETENGSLGHWNLFRALQELWTRMCRNFNRITGDFDVNHRYKVALSQRR